MLWASYCCNLCVWLTNTKDRYATVKKVNINFTGGELRSRDIKCLAQGHSGNL